MTEASFLAARNVSRETLERLSRYETLLRKWNPAINLVAKSTVEQIWTRHFLDSAQLFDLAGPEWHTWVDLGSGGGFPGLVIAILAAEERPEAVVTLIESDGRKAAFLANVSRGLGLRARIVNARIESVQPLGVPVLSARALAPLGALVGFAAGHLTADGVALFPKGANHAAELDEALEAWRFSYETTPSATDPNAVVFSIRDISRV